MKTLLTFLIVITFSNLTMAQTTAIPDANFEQALITKGLDATLDGQVLTANIDTLTNLDVYNKNIGDLTGIEDFIALTFLKCYDNNLTSLNVTQNTALTYLNCYWNQLTSFDVTQNTALDTLICFTNQLTSLDVTQNNALTYLTCGGNPLTTLDVTQNIGLTDLYCPDNQLTSLNVTQNTALIGLICDNNQFTSLDITQNVALRGISCNNTQLSNLDVTQNPALANLSCSNNLLTNLDVTQNAALTYLYCNDNALTNLDVTQNTLLKYLTCANNQLTILDVTQHTALTNLQCSNNLLTNLDVTQNTALTYLNCRNNLLTNIDVTKNTALSTFQCYNNQLTSLDASQNTLLTKILCYNNQLTCLNVRNGKNYIINSSDFNALGNPSLTCVEVDDSLDSFMSWPNVETWTSFSNNCNNACSTSLCNVSANCWSSIDSVGNYNFFNTSIGNDNKVHWAFGDGNTSTAPNVTHTFSANGTFVVVLTVNDSTKGSSCFDFCLDTIVVTGVVSPAQCAAGFVMYPDTTAGNITVINSATGANLTYLWDFGDGNTSTLQNPTHTYATSGPFNLCLTIDDGAGCVNMYCDSIGEYGVVFNKQSGFSINVISPPIVTGINNEIELNSAIIIYPNPTSHQLSIINNELSINKINIVDIRGKTVKTITTDLNIINVADLSSGIYFIQLNTEEGIVTKKFIKQ